MAQLNLTMLGGAAALFSGAASRPGGGTGTGALSRDPSSSFNYSIHHAPGHVPLHGPGALNQSILHISKLFGNVSGGANAVAAAASSSMVSGLLEGGYDLSGNITPCALTNETTGAMVALACNYSLSDNANITAPTTHGTGRSNPYTTLQLIVLAFLAGSTCITTIVGNLIVILSFVIERTIRQPTNYFIASLAVSDLLIGTFSMPFYTVYLLTGKYWPLGEVLCDLWLSVDYTVCLTSIYTVFCITIDRFCSVKIPAKYRAWRTDNKVTGVIALTWVIPILVFFTSIFGWQYFVGRRTVPEGMCYVQYMEDALFNCVLQLGYFWVTLTVMCVLYTGIYKVALDLQRKSNAKAKKMTSLVSMAGQTMTKIGIGMSKNQKKIGSKSLYECSDQANSNSNSKTDGAPKTLEPGHQNTTNFNSKEKDEDRSSSPAFPSDTDQSSQSPKHSKPPNSEGNNNNKGRGRKRQGKGKNGEKRAKRKREPRPEETGLTNLATTSPGLANSAYTEALENNNAPTPIVGNSLVNATRPFDVKRGSMSNHSVIRSPTTSPGGNCGGGGVVAVSLPHNSIAPLLPSAPLTVDCVEAANSMSQPEEADTALLQDEPASPSSMENMPSDSPPPYPALFQEVGSGTPRLSEGDFSFPPPPPHGTSCSESLGGRGSIRSGGAQSTSSGMVGEGHMIYNSTPPPPAEYGGDIEADHDGNMGQPSPIEGGVIDYPSPTPNFPETEMMITCEITTPPEFMSGLKYIDQDSLKSPLSMDNIRILSEASPLTGTVHQPPAPPPKERDSLVVEEPDSPVWKRRSLVERETRGGGNGGTSGHHHSGRHALNHSSPTNSDATVYAGGRHGSGSGGCGGSGAIQNGCDDSNAKSSPSVQKDSGDDEIDDDDDDDEEERLNQGSGGTNNNSSGGGIHHRTSLALATAHIQVETRQDSKTISRLAKPDEIQPLNADDGTQYTRSGEGSHGGSGKRGRGKAGSPLRGLIKSVGSRKFKRKKEKQPKSKSENRARKALRVITIILGAFVLCWTPWHILSMIIGFCPDDSGCVEPTLYDISYWLCYLNSPINPLCYAFANQQFKKTFIRILKLDWHRT